MWKELSEWLAASGLRFRYVGGRDENNRVIDEVEEGEFIAIPRGGLTTFMFHDTYDPTLFLLRWG